MLYCWYMKREVRVLRYTPIDGVASRSVFVSTDRLAGLLYKIIVFFLEVELTNSFTNNVS